jgi:hypothetical protein
MKKSAKIPVVHPFKRYCIERSISGANHPTARLVVLNHHGGRPTARVHARAGERN